jgi:tRNA 2-thiouridine synthesizing protein A
LVKADVVLDVTGEVCPLPLIKTRRALDKMEKDMILEVIGNDEEAKLDILMAVQELKMELIKEETIQSGKWRLLIRKTVLSEN